MSELTRSDYLRIKWSFVAMVASILAVVGLFAGLKALDTKATKTLAAARAENEKAQEQLDKISQEEASIIANKDKYQVIKGRGLVGEPDLLQMSEYFTQLRAEYDLSPITPTFSKQVQHVLPYGSLDTKKVDKPGLPVVLQMSNIDFKLGLLHENDLANLLNGLLSHREFLQVHSCSLDSRAKDDRRFLVLGQNISAACTLTWYSFRLVQPNVKPGSKP